MLRVILLIGIFISIQQSKVDTYLAQIPGFHQPSIFKNDIYQRCSTFEQLSVTDAANQIINPDSFDVHLMNACVFYATQQYRLKRQRNPIKISEPATMAASLWAAIMAKDKTYHGHFHPTRPDVKSLPKRMAIFDRRFEYEPCSENTHHQGAIIRISYKDLALRAIDGWHHSPGHRKNMLSNEWEYLGCGVAIAKHPHIRGAYQAYFVQNFH